MKIKISGIARTEHFYNFTEEPNLLGLEKEYFSPVISSVKLTKNNDQILIECDSSTEKKAICDRCLVEFDLKINSKFKIFYSYDPKIVDPLENLEELKYLTPDDDVIDLGDEVRQMLLLSTPLKLLCKDDCNGLCQKCGQDLNILKCDCSIDYTNPKFAELKKLNL
jgi:uncharacterized protein